VRPSVENSYVPTQASSLNLPPSGWAHPTYWLIPNRYENPLDRFQIYGAELRSSSQTFHHDGSSRVFSERVSHPLPSACEISGSSVTLPSEPGQLETAADFVPPKNKRAYEAGREDDYILTHKRREGGISPSSPPYFFPEVCR